ncbi:uncharacterized protein BcabD6B2_28100 [Babesia caballi]|uniref:Uncharacterized protein n=1 Tax=Babesia caballi TaxID=5871 RepID=A0AAV4LUV3_BABCB|nr:hypothetical protein, conserved [Babesia caballi]
MGDQKKSSLTDWSDNLKDVIDWFLRISFLNKSGKLKDAVEHLEGFIDATRPLGTFSVEGLFNKVASGLKEFIGYGGRYDITGEGIGRKEPPSYTSSYGDQAQWNGQLDDPNSEEAKKAAILFLCYMPILYLCIIYLYWRCSSSSHGGWGNERIHGNQSGLNIFMSAMGFKPSSELQNKLGSEIANRLINEPNGLDELKNAQSSSLYSDYLDKVTRYGQSQITHPINCPLYALYKASTAYLKFRFQEEKPTNQSLEEIREKIRTFHISCNSAPELKSAIGTFISICMSVPPKYETPSDNPSPAGPVAGTLTTISLGGGAAAAYLLNLGGAKTLVNGLLGMG